MDVFYDTGLYKEKSCKGKKVPQIFWGVVGTVGLTYDSGNFHIFLAKIVTNFLQLTINVVINTCGLHKR